MKTLKIQILKKIDRREQLILTLLNTKSPNTYLIEELELELERLYERLEEL
jgi:hypothetical protein